MKYSFARIGVLLTLALVCCLDGTPVRGALLAYEPFTNSPGTAIVGSDGGFGFSESWQANGSGGVATNTGYGLGYTDPAGKTLVASGGAGFFQGLTSANTSMQPTRTMGFARGTNGTDGVTTWISFIAVRQGPAVAGDNPYPRGANVPHDISATGAQKLAIGNSTSAATNTVGLIPQGNAGNLRPSKALFSATNFIVVRVNHVAGSANDNAYLFVNPALETEPLVGQADTNSLGAFDFTFDRVRVFAGGNASAAQPYAELLVDEYRVGQTFADVAPYSSPSNPPVELNIVITNAVLTAEGMALSGSGGQNNGLYLVLAAEDLSAPVTGWPSVTTNSFNGAGNFAVTSPAPAGALARFYRVRIAPPEAALAPSILTGPTNQTVLAGQSAVFTVSAGGTGPLAYQWFFNTNTALANETGATLTLADVQLSNAGTYSVRVTNSAGLTNSAPATLTVLAPPAITSQPASLGVVAGEDAVFSVTASGSAPLHYQWYFNTNTVLAGAVSSLLTITNAQTGDAGGYAVIVTNDYGAITSAVAQLTVSSTLITNGAYFVSPSGNDSNSGMIGSPFKTISRGLTAIGSGGLLYLRGGTYALSSKLSLSATGNATNRIRIWAYPGEVPLIDSTGNTGDGIGVSGRYYHLRGLEQMKAGHNGINISGHSNIVENCAVHDNGNTGLHITGGSSGSTYPSYNLILNCDAYLNYDPPVGENADGFSAKWNLGPGNVFNGCRAWWNSDDGWDLWMGTSPVLVTNCWAFWTGTNYWNSSSFDGNGNGFKLGGNYVGAPHRLVRCLAFQNAKHGIDENNNTAALIVDQNTSWDNGSKNFYLDHTTNNPAHIVRNNLSFDGASGDTFSSASLMTNNSWQVISPVPTTGDVQSADTSLVAGPRQADGSLPLLPFLRPVPGGRLIDQGVIIPGDAWSGAAPEIGAFEVP